jgi:hypothetical protein
VSSCKLAALGAREEALEQLAREGQADQGGEQAVEGQGAFVQGRAQDAKHQLDAGIRSAAPWTGSAQGCRTWRPHHTATSSPVLAAGSATDCSTVPRRAPITAA